MKGKGWDSKRQNGTKSGTRRRARDTSQQQPKTTGVTWSRRPRQWAEKQIMAGAMKGAGEKPATQEEDL